ncbi:MAG: tetratricopeptide repeat protein [Defluviicoccus sp.]
MDETAERLGMASGEAQTLPITLSVAPDEAVTLGIQRLRRKNFAAAEAALHAVLALDPANANALHFLGVLKHQTGEPETAIQLIEAALARAPGYADAHSNLGNVYKERGEHAKARDCYLKAIELNPRHVSAYNNLGVALRGLGEADAAVETLLKALELRPEDPSILQNLGNAYRTQKNYVAAIDAYRRAIAVHPYDRNAYKYLITTLYYLDQRDEAIKVLKQWMAFDPDNPSAHHLLAAYSGNNIPERATDLYVRELFDDFAASFDHVLQNINYRAPDLMQARVARLVPHPLGNLVVLDAGCGTGLCAGHLRPYACRLVGVDLSPKMLMKAKARNLYDALIEGELTAYLNTTETVFDLICSADALCYFGRLDDVFAGAARALKRGGGFIFSLEKGDAEANERGYHLAPHGRYTHAEAYVRTALAGAGLLVTAIETEVLRRECDADVAGLVVTAARVAP